MRQQLITWLTEDLAPEIHRTGDPEAAIIKFASEQNLAPALVQGLGQLYNTAKTLLFLEKAGSKRGASFPILDVDELVKKFLSSGVKSAGVAEGTIDHWELDGDGGALPACFDGLMTPAFASETVINAGSPNAAIKKAALDRSVKEVETAFANQVLADTNAAIEAQASKVAKALRENTDYDFAQLRADTTQAWSGDAHMQETLNRVAEFCANTHPRVKIANDTSPRKANPIPSDWAVEVIRSVEAIDDLFYKRAACSEFLKSANSVLIEEPPVTVKEDWFGGTQAEDLPPKSKARASQQAAPGSGLEDHAQQVTAGGKGELKKLPRDPDAVSSGAARGVLDQLNRGLDSIFGAAGREAIPALKSVIGGRNTDQELVDSTMQDTRQLAVLQNLLTTDEILSEADPDRVVEIYNTVRSVAPDIAGDANVMRVLLRSAIQHDGVSPFDLKNIIDTELAKQKVDFNRRLARDVDYAGAKIPVSNKPM